MKIKTKMKFVWKTLKYPKDAIFWKDGREVSRVKYIIISLRELNEFYKDVILRAKFGKGRKARIKEWRFKTRKSAGLFGKIFLRYNPRCTNYIIIGD